MFIPLHLPSAYLVGIGCFVLLNGWLRAEREGCPKGRLTLWLARVGVMSYSLYLTHVPALQVCEAAFHAGRLPATILGTLLRYAVCLPACLGVAWAFFRLVERHFLNGRQPGEVAAARGLTETTRVPRQMTITGGVRWAAAQAARVG
jgi:peptidoglycan/LPS O-acetylase OafA/YrhL